MQLYTYLQKKNVFSNEIFPLEFGFSGKFLLLGHFMQKNMMFCQFECMKGLNRPKSCFVSVDLGYSDATLKLHSLKLAYFFMILNPQSIEQVKTIKTTL